MGLWTRVAPAALEGMGVTEAHGADKVGDLGSDIEYTGIRARAWSLFFPTVEG